MNLDPQKIREGVEGHLQRDPGGVTFAPIRTELLEQAEGAELGPAWVRLDIREDGLVDVVITTDTAIEAPR